MQERRAAVEALLIDFLQEEIFDDAIVIKPHTHLVDAGFDSLALMRLLQFVEERLSVCIPEGEITENRILNVRNLADWICALGND